VSRRIIAIYGFSKGGAMRMSTRTEFLVAACAVLVMPTLLHAGDGQDERKGCVPAGCQAKAQADGPCSDKTNINRYVDCGNGTVTDQKTGLTWLKDVACATLGNPGVDWLTAQGNVAALKDGRCGLTDGSQPGDWRLPTMDDWNEAMDGVAEVCTAAPFWLNDAGTGCWGSGPSSFASVASGYYWSSSTFENYPGYVWMAGLDNVDKAYGHLYFKDSRLRAWPVLGGPR
jgi:hypothetical protein